MVFCTSALSNVDFSMVLWQFSIWNVGFSMVFGTKSMDFHMISMENVWKLNELYKQDIQLFIMENACSLDAWSIAETVCAWCGE